MTGVRSKSLARKTGINIVPIAVYVAVAVLVTGGMYVWDLSYRRQQEARRRPPEPEVLARNLVENIVGANTVRAVTVDREKKTVAVTFTSVLFKPEKPKKELRDLLEAEATLATQAILSQMRDYGTVTATLVHDGTTLATATATRGAATVRMTYVDARLKD
ncbi:MAG: hypothetical protein QN157_10735 [Armatimonadota bacterium]|nr:hypothetical protein [Armatimonadota bacterium]